MQCLFCGKELALLKRLRGGGEFCSEAHRKEYQDQYEQLALARLMQAKPPADAAPLGAPFGKSSPETAPSSGADVGPHYDPVPDSVSIATLETPAAATVQQHAQDSSWQSASKLAAEPVAQHSPESNPAPLAGFVTEAVVPAVTSFQQAGLEVEHAWERASNSPSVAAIAVFADAEPPASPPEAPPPAPRVGLSLSVHALDHHVRGSERGLELREFTVPAPVIEVKLHPGTGSDPAGAEDVMEIVMSPHPPQKAKPWLGAPRGFRAAPAELGDLARLDFATSGFAYSDSPATVPQSFAPPAGAPAQEPLPAATAVIEAHPRSAPPPENKPEAVTAKEQLPAAEPVAAEPPPPELITKALPVTLHGLAAGQRKLSQVFPRAMASASDVQIPASISLPLRPVIVFGPAPAPPPPRAAEPASQPAKSESASQPAKSEPAPKQPQAEAAAPKQNQPKPAPPKAAQTKSAQPERVPPTAAQPASVPLKPAERTQASVVPQPKPSAMKAAETPETRVKEPMFSPQTNVSAVPSLHLDATESAWSKLSSGVKIGVAAAIILAVSGVAYLVTRGGGKPASEPPAAVSAPAAAVATGVAISGGWIDDWANFSRSRRRISVLSGSAMLSDYRLEFQAQIQTKAIGWIFRGLNPRNYYVTKIEITTPGLQPKVALVHFAVVDGQDEKRVVVPLPMNVRVDTLYKIRFDAIGNRFTTWIQDQKVDEWSDNRFGSGGVGFFSERDEQAAMQGSVNVVPLVPKN